MTLHPRVAVAATLSLLAAPSWAQERQAVSEAQATPPSEKNLRDERLGIKPELGVLDFTDATSNTTNRGAIGVAVDLGFSRIFGVLRRDLYAGFSTGALFSHVGNAGSDFFGSGPSNNLTGSSGAYLLLVPFNGKFGVYPGESVRVSIHGGANLIYRSIPTSMSIGNYGDHWVFFPNTGLDLDLGLARNIAITLRPDWTITPGNNFFTGTLELGFAFS